MTKNYDKSVEENHSPNWPYILDYTYRVLIIGGSESGKTNVLLKLEDYNLEEYNLENLEDYNPTKKMKVLIVFEEMIADKKANKRLSRILPELFLRGRKRNISLIFISKPYFKVSKTIRLNARHYFIMRIPNKREFQQIASNNDFKAFMKLCKDYTKEPYLFLVNDTTLSSENPLRFRKNLL